MMYGANTAELYSKEELLYRSTLIHRNLKKNKNKQTNKKQPLIERIDLFWILHILMNPKQIKT